MKQLRHKDKRIDEIYFSFLNVDYFSKSFEIEEDLVRCM